MKSAVLPPALVLKPMLHSWLLEDIGRGDRTTQSLITGEVEVGVVQASWTAKDVGAIAGMPIAAQVFQLLSARVNFFCYVQEGEHCERGQVIARVEGPLDALLTGERVALNLAMRLSGMGASHFCKYGSSVPIIMLN